MEPSRRILRLPASLSSLLLLVSAIAPLAIAEPTLTDDSQCSCYVNDDDQSTYFTHHRFFDFRHHAHHAGAPPIIQDPDATAGADPTSPYFTSPEWTDFWMLSKWDNRDSPREDATVTMINSPNNVYLETSPDTAPETHLTLRTQRLPTFQTAAEIESASAAFQYLSIRMRARTLGSAGAITAMFTYRHSDTLALVQESDLEIRTSDPRGLVHYTNQPAYTDDGEVVPEATQNVTMPNGLEWSDWAVHRMDWTPGKTTWFVDGEVVAALEFQAPRDESNVILNAWSDGGEWTGNMTVGGGAYLQVQWLEMVFNNTEIGEGEGKRKRDGEGKVGCEAVCSVDQTPELGRPVMLWDNGAAGVNGAGRVVAWVPRGVVVVMVLLFTGLLG